MGGLIALTVRVDAGREYRGSCHTNVLPVGMWAAPFYDPIRSAEHAWSWLQAVLDNRSSDPELEEIWGGHNALAPVDYGLVLVDYVTSTLISTQGYSSPDWMIRWSYDEAAAEKWDALAAAGLLGEEVHPYAVMPVMPPTLPPTPRPRRIKLPFTNTVVTDSDRCDKALQRRVVDMGFKLSRRELGLWDKWWKEREA